MICCYHHLRIMPVLIILCVMDFKCARCHFYFLNRCNISPSSLLLSYPFISKFSFSGRNKISAVFVSGYIINNTLNLTTFLLKLILRITISKILNLNLPSNKWWLFWNMCLSRIFVVTFAWRLVILIDHNH